MPPSQMHLHDSIRLMPQDHKAVCNQETAAATPAMDIWISYGFHMDFIWIAWESHGDMVITGRTYHQNAIWPSRQHVLRQHHVNMSKLEMSQSISIYSFISNTNVYPHCDTCYPLLRGSRWSLFCPQHQIIITLQSI